MRRAVLTEQPLCVLCLDAGRLEPAVEVDHRVPLSKGGDDTTDNMQGLCKACHDIKTAGDLNRKPKGCDPDGLPMDPRHPWWGK